jgi:hypothetical protein
MRAFLFTVLIAGCGGSSETPVDGTIVPDVAPIGSCTPSGSTAPVTVDGPSSDSAIQVTFITHSAAGAVIAQSSVMGADATATLAVPACGMVSVVEVDGAGSTHVVTWTEVQPGDHLIHTSHAQPATQRDVTVQVPALAGATEYQLLATCSPNHLELTSTSNPGAVMMTPECTGSAVSISVTAKTATSSQLAIMTTPLAASGPTTVTIPGYSTPATSTLSAHDLGAAELVAYSTYARQSDNLLALDRGTAVPTAGAATATAPLFAGAGGYDVEVDTTAGSGTQRSLVIRSVAAVPASVEITPADLLPAVTATLDANTPSITWDSTAHGAAALLAMRAGNNEWDLIAPGVAGTVTFPQLPTGLWPTGTLQLTGAAVFESADATTYHANNLATLLMNFPAEGHQVRYSVLDGETASARMQHRIARWRR